MITFPENGPHGRHIANVIALECRTEIVGIYLISGVAATSFIIEYSSIIVLFETFKQ